MNSWWEFGEHGGHSGDELMLGIINCAFCSESGHFKNVSTKSKSSASSGKTLHYDTIQCENCGNYMFVFWSASSYGGTHGLHNFLTLPWPIGKLTAPTHWPEDLKRFWLQAHNSLDGDNLDAAALMARSALQFIVRDQGAEKSSLFNEIKDLHTKGILPPVMYEFATKVRELGNDSAHPGSISSATTKEDAQDIIEFLDILTKYLYDLPKKIEDYSKRKTPTK